MKEGVMENPLQPPTAPPQIMSAEDLLFILHVRVETPGPFM